MKKNCKASTSVAVFILSLTLSFLTIGKSFSQCFTATINTVNPSCAGSCNGSASAIITGGSGTFNYAWGPSGITSATFNNLCASTYSVTIIDTNVPSCTAVLGFTITAPTIISLTKSSKNATCGQNNGSASASASGGTGTLTYTWSNGGTGQTINNLSAGTYNLSVIDSKGCLSTSSVVISSITSPSVSVSVTSSISCFGSPSATADVSGGTADYTYNWSNGATTITSSSNDSQQLIAGTYTVTLTDANGCSSTSTVSISSPPAININSITPTNSTCGGSNGSAVAAATGGSGTLSYSWSNAATGQTVSGLSVGIYTLTVADGNGCTKTTSVTINNSDGTTIVTSVSSPILCNGGNGTLSVMATGGTANYTYNWSTGASTVTSALTNNLNGVTAGSYTVSVTDANGCSSVSTVILTEPTQLVGPLITVQDATCGLTNGSVYASASGGTGAYTFSWSNSATGQTSNNLSSGVYTITVQDANNCSSTSTAMVNAIPPPILSASVSSPILCTGMTGNVTATVTAGTPNFTYSWSNSANSVTSNPTSQISNLTSAVYSVTVTDANGCVSISTASLISPVKLTVTGTINTPTCNTNDGSIVANPSGGTANYTYTWSNAATGATANNLGVGIYSVTATDANTCTATYSAIVSNTNGPSVSITVVPATCGSNNGAIVTKPLETDAFTYSWSTGDITSYVTGLQVGSYTLTLTNSNGCKTIYIEQVDCVTGINEQGNILFMNILPNPSDGNFVLETRFAKAGKVVISMTNILGETVMLIDNVQQTGFYYKQVSVENIPVGIYFLVVERNNERLVKKIILK